MPSILESLTAALGQGDTLAKLGSVMDGSAEQAEEAVGAAGPAVLAALARNAETDEGAEPIADLVDAVGSGPLDDVDGFLDRDDTEVGDGLLDFLFGQDRRALLGGLSDEGDVSSDSYAKGLPYIAPLVVSAVAKQKEADGLDPEGLTSLLVAERAGVEGDGGLGDWFEEAAAGGGALAVVAGVALLARNAFGGAAGAVATWPMMRPSWWGMPSTRWARSPATPSTWPVTPPRRSATWPAVRPTRPVTPWRR